MERAFERVYTVYDFYDGPRAGFADFEGIPHAYRSIWREDLDDWDPEARFYLWPVSPDVLALVLEDWAIWQRWQEAFYAGQTIDTTHLALSADRPRHAELAPVIARVLEVVPADRRIAIGEFRAQGDTESGSDSLVNRAALEVRWQPAE